MNRPSRRGLVSCSGRHSPRQRCTTLSELLSDEFLRELHERLYGDIWAWAGGYRTREPSIGVVPWNIGPDLVQSFETIRYRWSLGHWTPRQLGIAAHAESVRVHPFADGNGRTTRLLGTSCFCPLKTMSSTSTTGTSTVSTSGDTSSCSSSSTCTANPVTWRTTCRCAHSASSDSTAENVAGAASACPPAKDHLPTGAAGDAYRGNRLNQRVQIHQTECQSA